MDLLDLNTIFEFMKVEPGHGLVQSVLLFMIWWQSRGLRQEMSHLHDSLADTKAHTDVRFEKIEGRITVLENRGSFHGSSN